MAERGVSRRRSGRDFRNNRQPIVRIGPIALERKQRGRSYTFEWPLHALSLSLSLSQSRLIKQTRGFFCETRLSALLCRFGRARRFSFLKRVQTHKSLSFWENESAGKRACRAVVACEGGRGRGRRCDGVGLRDQRTVPLVCLSWHCHSGTFQASCSDFVESSTFLYTCKKV